MIDLIYLTHNRLEFTRASFLTMIRNTDWSLVRRLILYDDNSIDGTEEFMASMASALTEMPPIDFRHGKWGGPVAIMNHYLTHDHPSDVWAKIDNDVMLPPLWLNECLDVMNRDPKPDLLGIEPFSPAVAGRAMRLCRASRHIGGIGLMRTSAFSSLPVPRSVRFGFTEWQWQNKHAMRGWIEPALPVFLLDRVASEPWRSLSLNYERHKWQRPWKLYSEEEFVSLSQWCEESASLNYAIV